MRQVTLEPHPKIRILSFLLGIGGTLLSNESSVLLLVWLVIMVPIITINKLIKKHLQFLILIIFPIFLALMIVWGIVLKTSPGYPIGFSQEKGIEYALIISLRLLLLASIFQSCFLSINNDKLLKTFQNCGLKGKSLIIMMGTFSVWPEIKLRAQQVITARFARGLVTNVLMITRFKQLPYIFRPLVTWTLRASFQRARIWEHLNILKRIENSSENEIKYSKVTSVIFLLASSTWVCYNIVFLLCKG